jgi:hypothetical protein
MRREMRVVVAGAAVAVGAWLGLRGVPRAVARIAELEEEVEQRVLLLEKSRLETSGLRALSDSIAHLEEVAASLHRVLLLGGEPTTATFDLTRRVSEVLSRSAAFVDEIAPVPDSARAGRLRRTQVRADLETDVIGLMGALQRLEADSTLRVESVEVSVAAPEAPLGEVERLGVALQVSGWFMPTTSEDEAPPSGGGT